MPLVYSTPNNESNAVKDKGYLMCGKYSYIVNSNGLLVIHLSQTYLTEQQC
jgi:hypothetical protein